MDITLTQILHRLLPDIEWLMNDNDLSTLTILSPNVAKPTQNQVDAMLQIIEQEIKDTANAKSALLNRLGITEDEAKLLLA
jgi:hypothetical protein